MILGFLSQIWVSQISTHQLKSNRIINSTLKFKNKKSLLNIPKTACHNNRLTTDGVYDCAWSEANENVIATGQGDGTIKLFDVNNPQGPILNLHEHQQEVYSVDWNLNMPDLLLSGSWDSTCIVWDLRKNVALRKYKTHSSVCYTAVWSPHNGGSNVGGGRVVLQVVVVSDLNQRQGRLSPP